MPKQWTEIKEFQGKPVTVDMRWIDSGIGSYEFWGAVGNHQSWEVEILSITDAEGKQVEIDEETEEAWRTQAENTTSRFDGEMKDG